jgi:type IV pilus assembly protein PilM
MKKLVDKLQRYFRKSKGSMLGIDIGTSTVKLAELVYNKKHIVLRNAVVVGMPAGLIEDGYVTDETALGELLQNAIVVNGIQAKKVAVTVSGRSVFMREIFFPAMTSKELEEAIKWDMGKYVPFEPDTYHYDYAVIAEGDEAMKMKVLLVAAPHSLLNGMLGGIRKAGLQVLRIDIEPLAIYHSLVEAENSMVVDIGGSAGQVIVFQNGSPNVTRAIPINGERFTRTIMEVLELDFAEAERLKQKKSFQKDTQEASVLHNQIAALIAELAREIRRTIEYFQVQNKYATVEKIFLTGGGARLPNLAAQLSAELNMTVLLTDPILKITISNSLDTMQWRDMSPQFSVAIGLALAEVVYGSY